MYLRHQEKAFVYGSFRVLDSRKDRFVYERRLGNRVYVVDCNLGAKPCRAYQIKGQRKLVYDTVRRSGRTAANAVPDRAAGIARERAGSARILEAYEARIWRLC